jgi:hypothetical protein
MTRRKTARATQNLGGGESVDGLDTSPRRDSNLVYMHVEADQGTPMRNRFTELLNLRFGPPLRANPLGDLAACRRTGTVADYCEQFLSLLAHAGKLSQSQQVQLFTVGLQPPLNINVQIQAPQSLNMAMSLATSYELREQTVAALPHSSRSSTRPALLPMPATPLPLPAPPNTQETTTTTTGVAPMTQVTG